MSKQTHVLLQLTE